MSDAADNLGRKMARGTAWVTGSSYVVFVISFGTGIVLARSIEPSVFGVFAFAAAIVGLMRMVAGIGYPDYLIRREEADDEVVETVFAVALMLAAGIVLLWAIAVPFLWIFGSVELVGLTAILAAAAPVGIVGEVPHALLQREFALRRIAMIQLVAGVVACAATLATVLMGGTLSALVVNGIAMPVLAALLYFGSARRSWTRLRWNRRVVGELREKAKSFFGTGVIMTLTGQLDKIAVGIMMPEAQLGYYNRAQRMSGLFSVIVPTAVTRSILPAFSAVRSDRPKLEFTYGLMMSLHLLVLGPLGVGVFFAVEPMIELLYGARWLPTAPAFRVLAVVVVLTPLVGIWLLLQISLNHPERVARARVAGLLVFLPALWFGIVHWGIVGAAGAVVCFELTSFVVLGAYASRFFGTFVTLRPIWPHVVSVAVSFLLVRWMLGAAGVAGMALLVQLAVIGGATLLVYGMVLLAIDRKRTTECVGYLFEKLGLLKKRDAEA